MSGITKEYGTTPGEITAITFNIRTAPSAPQFTIRMPADKEKALQALWLDYVDGDKLSPDGNQIIAWSNRKKKTRKDFVQQAERTAWKIMQDWVEVQMSMIQLKQAEFTEVFMPYIYDGEQTVYERVKAGGMRLLLPEKTE